MKHLNHSLDNQGASLIETMVAFAIFGIMVISIYPTFTEITKIGKSTAVRRLCQQIVSSKLESYKSGYPIDLNAYATLHSSAPVPANTSQLMGLSLESYSDDSMGALSLTSSSSGVRTLSGFSYAKIRYNHLFPSSCNGASLATLTSAMPQFQNLGMRECIGSPTAGTPAIAMPDVAGPPTQCTSKIDTRVGQELPGFKLYVKLELETPWRYGDPATAAAASISPAGDTVPSTASRLHDRCPNMGNPSAASTSFDFSGQSDAIKVTVTGVIDYLSLASPPNGVGGTANPFELTCQSSAVLTPYRYPARYMITSQSKIYSIHGTAWNKTSEDGPTASNMVYRNVYSNGLVDATFTSPQGSVPSNSILSIAVHPRDTSIWVLRPGLLARYSNCHGTPINCDVGDIAANASGGFPDISTWGPIGTSWPQVQSWNVPTGISSIGVDFRSGRVYGFAKSQSGGVVLELTNGTTSPVPGTPLGQCAVVDCTPPPPASAMGAGGSSNNVFRGEVSSRVVDCLNDAATPQPVLCTDPTARKAEFPRPYFTSIPERVNSFFMSPSGESAFVTDNTASIVLGEEVYSASAYRITDRTLSVPIMTLPFYVTGFSM